MGITYAYSPFRKEYHEMVKNGDIHGCPFCEAESLARQSLRDAGGALVENAGARWIVNHYPYCDGHTMVVPKRHVTSIHDLAQEEILAHHSMVRFAADTLQKLRPEAGIEVFLQYGNGSRMSLPHLHTHVVLSLPTDTYRGMQKLGHFEAFEENEEKILIYPVKVNLGREDLIKALAPHIDLRELAKYSEDN